jgi:hypothetical protein
MELDSYLRSAYLDEKAEVGRLRSLTRRVLSVFASSYDETENAWPYELVEGTERSKARFSFPTNAMILFTLTAANGTCPYTCLLPRVRPATLRPDNKEDLALTTQFDKIIPQALQRIIDESAKLTSSLTYSPTFGEDDPLTMAWLLDLLIAQPEKADAPTGIDGQTYGTRLKRIAEERITALKTPDEPILKFLDTKQDGTAVPHSFPLLRIVQLYQQLRDRGLQLQIDTSNARRSLQNRVHFHLSLSEIPNSSFDAAELAFSLEGALLLNPESPDLPTIDRAFATLAERQQASPYWRPLRPIKVTSQGLILLPQSVEIANSLLRVCDLLDRREYGTYFTNHVDLFKHYARWLEARLFRASDGRFMGWESEHTHTLNRVHLWQTSQAWVFIQHYSAMLQRHIGETSLRAARFLPTKFPGDETKADERWERWAQQREPLGKALKGSSYRVYESIGRDFVSPRAGGTSSRQSSMLLYGPPGTGKSTIARGLAKCLGYSFLTITPSDFISEGSEGVEARAKAIFQILREQDKLVILFDEIDQLLLDRESSFYGAQGDLFKLMTPGMLTKLNQLGEEKQNIFVVATNYFERIDRAIKRPGRIDARYLVLPPDLGQRERFLADEREDPKGTRSNRIPGWTTLDAAAKAEVARRTLFCTFSELRDLAARVTQSHPDVRGEDLKNALLTARNEQPPITSLDAYRARLGLADGPNEEHGGHEDGDEKPLEEFALLCYLSGEAEQSMDWEEWVRVGLQKALKTNVIKDSTIASRIKELSQPG